MQIQPGQLALLLYNAKSTKVSLQYLFPLLNYVSWKQCRFSNPVPRAHVIFTYGQMVHWLDLLVQIIERHICLDKNWKHWRMTRHATITPTLACQKNVNSCFRVTYTHTKTVKTTVRTRLEEKHYSRQSSLKNYYSPTPTINCITEG